MPRVDWTRDQILVAFNIFCRTAFGRLHRRNPEIISVAQTIGRTPSALAMKCCNLAAFDAALQSRGIKGLSKGSRMDREVWEDFQSRPEDVAFESEMAFARLTNVEVRSEQDVCWEDVHGLDQIAVTKVRVNQHFFRSIVLAGYRNQCAVCELPLSSLLVAAHIVPWSLEKPLRMNPQNGICLCAIHDRAFDKGVLRIASDYKISIHPRIQERRLEPAVEDYLTKFDGTMIHLPDRWHPDPLLLNRHGELTALLNVS
jgi:putative restriction endonuclease